MIRERLATLQARLVEANLDGVALVPGPNLAYLTGLRMHPSERPVVAFLDREQVPVLLLPGLEAGRAASVLGDQVRVVSYTDEAGPGDAFCRAAELLSLANKRYAVEYLHMRVLELRALEQAAPSAKFVSLESDLPDLRIVKDTDEIAAMRRAIAITEEALSLLISEPVSGLTERQIASRLSQQMVQLGADGIAFIIVVAGPNSADPHAGPSNRPVQSGDLMTIDFGAVVDGYPADLTRTFVIGEPSEEQRRMYDAVLRANKAGRRAVGPGVPAEDIDRAARQEIETAGYGEFFIHRTGHGLGLQVHEPPYIVEGNTQPVVQGAVFTIEPGVYVPGFGGVRIEDNVQVTADGVDCLTGFPRDLTSLV